MTTNVVAVDGHRHARTGMGHPLIHADRYWHDRHEDGSDIPDRPDKIETLQDLATRQGIFDHVVTQLLDQGGRAPESQLLEDRELFTGDGLHCVYRSNSRRSPIGFLITDAAYDDDLELLHIYSRDSEGGYPIIEAIDPRISRDRETIRMIWMLQMAHDNPRASFARRCWRTDWKHVMELRARLWGLDASSLQGPWGRS